MSAVQRQVRCVAQRLSEAGPAQLPFAEADQDQPGPSALTFDQGVGRQGGGEGDQADVTSGLLRRAAGLPQHGIERLTDAHGQVAPRRQRLGMGDQAAAFLEEDRICVGAASVDPEQKRHNALTKPQFTNRSLLWAERAKGKRNCVLPWLERKGRLVAPFRDQPASQFSPTIVLPWQRICAG